MLVHHTFSFCFSSERARKGGTKGIEEKARNNMQGDRAHVVFLLEHKSCTLFKKPTFFYLSLQIFVLVSAGHAIYFQTCYSKAAKVLAKCQPWIASQSSSEFKVACIGSTSYSGFSYKSYNTYDSIGEQWLEEGGSCVSFCQV